MADKLVIQKREHGKIFTMLNVTVETKEKIDQVAKETGVARVDVASAMVNFAIDHLEIVDNDQ